MPVSVSVQVNGTSQLAQLRDQTEKIIDLPAGRHLIQLVCAGTKSKPFPVDLSDGRHQTIRVAMNRKGRISPLLLGASVLLWVPLLLSRNLWLSIVWALAIIILNGWIFNRKHRAFSMRIEEPA